MAYAEIGDIQFEFKDTSFSSSTAMSAGKVQSYLDQEEDKIDGMLSTVYSVPITGVISKSIVKTILIFYVKARIEEVLQVKTGNIETEQGGVNSYRALADKMIEQIKNKQLILTDATPISGGGISSYTYQEDIDQTFSATTEQW